MRRTATVAWAGVGWRWLATRCAGVPTAAPQALADIRLLADQQRSHHLQLLLTDADGPHLLSNDQALAVAAPMRALLVRHRRLNRAGA